MVYRVAFHDWYKYLKNKMYGPFRTKQDCIDFIEIKEIEYKELLSTYSAEEIKINNNETTGNGYISVNVNDVYDDEVASWEIVEYSTENPSEDILQAADLLSEKIN